MVWIVDARLGLIVAVLLVLYGLAQHFWLVLFTVGPAALIGMWFVKSVWDWKDRRRLARSNKGNAE